MMDVLALPRLCTLWLVIISALQNVLADDTSCHVNCTCDWTRHELTCLNIFEIPGTFPNCSEVVILTLNNNHMTEIRKGDLSHFTSLKYLDMGNNSISWIDPGSFDGLFNLHSIDLQFNKLTEIGDGIFSNIKNLTSLYFGSNSIENVSIAAFENLNSLVVLDLSHNRLSQFNVLPLPGLSRLSLQHNNIEMILNSSCKNMTSLQTLSLYSNKLTVIKDGNFGGCSKLQNLYLEDNRIRDIESMAFFPEYMLTNTMHTIHLNNNSLKRIPPGLAKLTELKVLDITENLFENIIPSDFKGLGKLMRLHISYMPKLTKVESLAFTSLVLLETLSMCCNSKLTYIAKNAFFGLENLKSVYLNNNRISNFPEHLFRWNTLHHLNIRSNHLVCGCELKWMTKPNVWPSFAKNMTKELKCASPGKPHLPIRKILKLTENDFGICPGEQKSTKSRIVTGLVASVIGLIFITLFVLFLKYRRTFMIRWKYYRYTKQSDEAPFTVDNEFSDYPTGKEELRLNEDL